MVLQEKEESKQRDIEQHTPGSERERRTDCPPDWTDCPLAVLGSAQEGGAEGLLASFLTFAEHEKRDTTPLLLTRGVQTHTPCPDVHQKTIIDWLTITANETIEILQQFVSISIPKCSFILNSKGVQGYKSTIDIVLNGEQLGKIAFNGTSSKNMLVLTGNGTEKVKSWNQYVYWLKLLKDVSISQIHIALDDYEGLFMSHDIVKQAYDDLKFKSSKARVNPSISINGKTTGNGVNKGRTWDIGKNKGCVKHFCGYEKGLEQFFQLFNKLPEHNQEILIPKITIGDVTDDKIKLDTSILKWYRGEVKFHNNGVKLPIEMILERDSFYAGSYPFCEEILPMVEKKIPDRLPTNFELAIEEMFVNCGNSYGSGIFTALSVAQHDGRDLRDECVEIVKKIMKNHHSLNQKIIKTGGLNHIAPFDPNLLNAPQDE